MFSDLPCRADVVPGRQSGWRRPDGRLLPPLTAGHGCAVRHRDGWGERHGWPAGRRGPPGPSPKRGRGRAQREPDPSVLRKLGTDRHHLPGVAPEAALPPGSLSRNPVLTSDAKRSLRRLEPHGQSTCQPTSRAPPGTREALIGRRGSPVASLALGPVIGQWGHRARHRGGGTPGRLATRPRQVRAARIVLEVGS